MEYRRLNASDMGSVKRLYEEAGWTAYLKDGAKLNRAWEKSLFSLGAFEGGELVGFIRCLGDGEHTVLIQDLLVEEKHQRKGIGGKLMRSVFEEYRDVRQIFVVTDAGSPAVRFYRALGLHEFEKGGLLAFYN
ncbi:MAG: GNAT family N-acetyltransferase [Clostridia bacterium]|nr:GNAT family N-acetyltransferase [Clostridia bacterium]